MINTTIQGFDKFVQLRNIQDELGINEDKLDELIQTAYPKIYEQWLYGCRYIRLEDYKRIEGDFLKNRHKKATLRQAAGLIATWDCLNHSEDDSIVAEKWSKLLNTKMSGSDVSDMIYSWVNMREMRHTVYKRPDDEDFKAIGEKWGDRLRTRISADDAYRMMEIYLDAKILLNQSDHFIINNNFMPQL